jgi:hypothetical protein
MAQELRRGAGRWADQGRGNVGLQVEREREFSKKFPFFYLIASSSMYIHIYVRQPYTESILAQI